MTIDQGGNEVVSPEAREIYNKHDKNVDDYVDAVIACLRELPTPKPHTLPAGTNRMRYAPLERAFMTATHGLLRDYQRWKEGRG